MPSGSELIAKLRKQLNWPVLPPHVIIVVLVCRFCHTQQIYAASLCGKQGFNVYTVQLDE